MNVIIKLRAECTGGIIISFSTLNDNMFYCLPWENTQHRSIAKGYRIIISDVIFGNDAHTLLQIHIAVKRGDRVVTVPELFCRHASTKHERLLAEFESGLRQCVSRNVIFKAGVPDSNTVKVWYYQPEASPPHKDGTAQELYCRIALTAANISAPDADCQERILSGIREYLTGFINQMQ